MLGVPHEQSKLKAMRPDGINRFGSWGAERFALGEIWPTRLDEVHLILVVANSRGTPLLFVRPEIPNPRVLMSTP